MDTLTPSASWRKPEIVTSLADRIILAKAAIDQAVSMLNPNQAAGVGQQGTIYWQMADFDRVTKQTYYKVKLKTLFSATAASNPGFKDDYGYGYAAALAYSVYKDPDFLSWARDIWEFGRTFTLSEGEVASGKIATKDFPLQSQCTGHTMAGGTFQTVDPDDPTLATSETAYFLLTSALLAEVTGNSTYLSAAQASADFIQSQLVDRAAAMWSISARRNDSCTILNHSMDPYNQGLFIEGLAVLHSLSTGNEQTQTHLDQAMTAAFNSNWQNNEGIISFSYSTPAEKSGDLYIPQGLIEAYNRNLMTENLRTYIEAYLGVQYNAVIDFADNGRHIYANAWTIPASSTILYSPGPQTSAVAVLLSGISIVSDSTSSSASATGTTTATSTPPPPSPSQQSTKHLTGPIFVGGTSSKNKPIGVLIG
ncbi:hypothetical protein C8J56DRAFT_1031209 [Mycena floridula]|nr:hypothetical protein C8J56DRAFT_1031209 [Mycena floridula]